MSEELLRVVLAGVIGMIFGSVGTLWKTVGPLRQEIAGLREKMVAVQVKVGMIEDALARTGTIPDRRQMPRTGEA